MPAVVAGHEVRRAPSLAGRLEKGDPLVGATGRLEHVRERMSSPGVLRIEGERLSRRLLRAAEFAGLLEAERVGAQNEAGQRMDTIPRRQNAGRRIADRRGLAQKEIGVLGQAQRQRVGRPLDQDRLPDERGVDRPALGPGPDGGHMQPFALRCVGKPVLGGGERADDLRMVAAESADQEQPRDRRRAQSKGRVVGERLLQRADRVAGQAPIVRDRAIVRPG